MLTSLIDDLSLSFCDSLTSSGRWATTNGEQHMVRQVFVVKH
jgi:hypothetical protein